MPEPKDVKETTKKPFNLSLKQFFNHESIAFYAKFKNDTDLVDHIFEQFSKDEVDYTSEEIEFTIQVHTTRYNIIKLLQTPKAKHFMELEELLKANNNSSDFLRYLKAPIQPSKSQSPVLIPTQTSVPTSLQTPSRQPATQTNTPSQLNNKTPSQQKPETNSRKHGNELTIENGNEPPTKKPKSSTRLTESVPKKYLNEWFINRITPAISKQERIQLNSKKETVNRITPVKQYYFNSSFVAQCLWSLDTVVEIAEGQATRLHPQEAAKFARNELDEVVKGFVDNDLEAEKNVKHFLSMNFGKLVNPKKLNDRALYDALVRVL